MKYNSEYLDIKYALINTFLIDAQRHIVDISYSIEKNEIIIQLVIIKHTSLGKTIIDKVKNNLREFEVKINIIYISKEEFNDNKGNWNPSYYSWLPYVLLSKAEIL